MELYRQVALYDIVSFSPTTCKPYVVEESSSDAYRLELRAASGRTAGRQAILKALTNYVKLIDDDKRNASIKELADIVSDQ